MARDNDDTSGRSSRQSRREIDQAELFEAIERNPSWDARRLAEELGYSSANKVRRYIRRYINRGDLREVIEVLPGERRPLNSPFLVGIVTDQDIYRGPGDDDYPPDATYRDQQALTEYLLANLSDDDVLVHDAMLVLGAPFDILLFASSRRGIEDIAPLLITTTLRRYRGVANTLTMPVGAWHRR